MSVPWSEQPDSQALATFSALILVLWEVVTG